MPIRLCPNCNKQISDDAIKCYKCGERFVSIEKKEKASQENITSDRRLRQQNFALAKIISIAVCACNLLAVVLFFFFFFGLIDLTDYTWGSEITLAAVIALFSLNIWLMIMLYIYLRNFDIEVAIFSNIRLVILAAVLFCTTIILMLNFRDDDVIFYSLTLLLLLFVAIGGFASSHASDILKDFDDDYVGMLYELGEAMQIEREKNHDSERSSFSVFLFFLTPFYCYKLFAEAADYAAQHGTISVYEKTQAS